MITLAFDRDTPMEERPNLSDAEQYALLYGIWRRHAHEVIEETGDVGFPLLPAAAERPSETTPRP